MTRKKVKSITGYIEQHDARLLREIREKRTAINKLNRARAKAMERRVMKELGGKRTPMSGASDVKGDGLLPNGGVVECKMSAVLHKSGSPVIRVPVEWFTKLHKDVQSMYAPFGILVLHFHGKSVDFVCVPTEYAQVVFGAVPELEDAYFRTTNHSFVMLYTTLLEALKMKTVLWCQYTSSDQEFFLMELNAFIERYIHAVE